MVPEQKTVRRNAGHLTVLAGCSHENETYLIAAATASATARRYPYLFYDCPVHKTAHLFRVNVLVACTCVYARLRQAWLSAIRVAQVVQSRCSRRATNTIYVPAYDLRRVPASRHEVPHHLVRGAPRALARIVPSVRHGPVGFKV